MYITNKPAVARIAEEAGVDWIFVDMEFIGKDNRQGGLDTVQNHHTIEDIRRVKSAVSRAKVLVRVNPIHDALPNYFSSEDEVVAAIEAGADIVMLPFFHSVQEVQNFVQYIKTGCEHVGKIFGKDVCSCLLLETPEAAILLDEILNVDGVHMIHIGLNDLHLAMGMKFMFQLLTNGIVDQLAKKIKEKGIPFGVGGIASLHTGAVPGTYILKEHYRLGSSMVIVGRSFCNTNIITDEENIRRIFNEGIAEIRKLEAEAQEAVDYFKNNHQMVIEAVDQIVEHKVK